jgi:hypothetical protein
MYLINLMYLIVYISNETYQYIVYTVFMYEPIRF